MAITNTQFVQVCYSYFSWPAAVLQASHKAAEELFLQFWQNQREQQFAVPKPHGKRGGRDHLLLEHFSLISFILCRAFSGLLKEAGTGLCCITRMSFIFRKIKSSFLARQIKFAAKLQW